MENYDLSIDSIKEKNWVIQRVQESLNNFKNNINSGQTTSEDNNPDSNEWTTEQAKQETEQKEWATEQQEVSTENEDFFYEKINDEKVTLKMDIVINYLKNIKDKEWVDLRSTYTVAWIMAVQIALRCPKIWWENHNKYWEIKIDGFLGPETKAAVEKFQAEYWLQKIDGLPGKETMNKMYELLTWEVVVPEWNGDAATGSNENGDAATESDDNGDDSWNNDSDKDVGKDDAASSWSKNSWNNKEVKEKEPKDSDIVSIEDYTKWTWILFDIRYATSNNFTKKVVYKGDEAIAKLRYWTIKKLKKAQEEVRKQGYSLKIWDGYRSDAAQEFLYTNKPKGLPVAKPNRMWGKWSQHARWNTVDITLVKADWTEIPMPSDFDSNKTLIIDRNYGDLNNDQRNNAKILENAMKKAWFTWLQSEWWHYSDTKSYPHQWKLKS